jgi:CheY-like chemotaxis protein
VTLDISMPKASGTRFYKEVKTDPALASIPVVIITVVTGYGGDPHGYEKFISSRNIVTPPEGFFPKPIDREEFLATVKKLLR